MDTKYAVEIETETQRWFRVPVSFSSVEKAWEYIYSQSVGTWRIVEVRP